MLDKIQIVQEETTKNIKKNITKIIKIIFKNSKNYYENNKDKINTHYICDFCNGRYTHNNRAKHFNTQKHQTAVNNND